MADEPLFISILGSGYPADSFIETELAARLPGQVRRYGDLLARHLDGKHTSDMRLRVQLLAGAIGEAPGPVHIIGRSSGAIIATRYARRYPERIAGIVALAYPFRHPDLPDQPHRTDHLPELVTPTLILQGQDDPYGRPGALSAYPMSSTVTVEPVATDHSFRIQPAAWDAVAARIRQFVRCVAMAEQA